MSADEFSLRQFANKLQNQDRSADTGRLTTFLKRKLISQLDALKFGSVTIIDGSEQHIIHGQQRPDWVHAEILVKHPQFYRFIAFGGSVGAAEAYMLGYWDSQDLTRVIRLFAINQQTMDDMEGGFARLAAPLKKVFHWLNKNTTQGARRNIAAHYDLGNELFQAFLDPTMMYSSGIYTSADSSLEQASTEKIDRICRRLRLSPADKVIEIGTGWGSFAIHAAKHYGCHVTTTTISREQYELARERVTAEGLEAKITLLFEDYRNLNGQYDKLVSIEMIEAVGHHFYEDYFSTCSKLLKEDGEFLLQAITIADQRFDAARKEIDFIKRYIFPGSCIPSVNAISESITQATDMRIVDLFDMGSHYARTLLDWHDNFNQAWPSIKAHGYDETFRRMWNFYLCYCAGGFQEGVISVAQIHMVKPLSRRPYYVNEVNDY